MIEEWALQIWLHAYLTDYMSVFFRSFEKKNLGQMKTVCPSAYTFQQEKGLPYFHGDNEAKVEYQLTVDVNVGTVDGVQSLEENNTKHAAADHRVSKCNFRTTISSLLIARRRIFHEKLIEIVKRYHQVLGIACKHITC